tara:strand:+ start:577 stop:726 length:150 start_codon:yes stop_codon:yes gene_type:complete
MEFIKEFFEFLKDRKKLWLIPLLIIIFIFAGMIILVEGTVVAPLIYTVF